MGTTPSKPKQSTNSNTIYHVRVLETKDSEVNIVIKSFIPHCAVQTHTDGNVNSPTENTNIIDNVSDTHNIVRLTLEETMADIVCTEEDAQPAQNKDKYEEQAELQDVSPSEKGSHVSLDKEKNNQLATKRPFIKDISEHSLMPSKPLSTLKISDNIKIEYVKDFKIWSDKRGQIHLFMSQVDHQSIPEQLLVLHKCDENTFKRVVQNLERNFGWKRVDKCEEKRFNKTGQNNPQVERVKLYLLWENSQGSKQMLLLNKDQGFNWKDIPKTDLILHRCDEKSYQLICKKLKKNYDKTSSSLLACDCNAHSSMVSIQGVNSEKIECVDKFQIWEDVYGNSHVFMFHHEGKNKLQSSQKNSCKNAQHSRENDLCKKNHPKCLMKSKHTNTSKNKGNKTKIVSNKDKKTTKATKRTLVHNHTHNVCPHHIEQEGISYSKQSEKLSDTSLYTQNSKIKPLKKSACTYYIKPSQHSNKAPHQCDQDDSYEDMPATCQRPHI